MTTSAAVVDRDARPTTAARRGRSRTAQTGRDRPTTRGRRRRRARPGRTPATASATTSASGTTAMPAICATAISGIARKFSARPAKVTRENRQRADRKQQRFGGGRGGEHRRPTGAQSRSREQSAPSAHQRPGPTRIASVAPKVRTNAGSATDSGSAASRHAATQRQRVERRAALIGGAGGEVDDRHQRRAIDRRAAADQRRVRDQQRRSTPASPSGRADRRAGTPPSIRPARIAMLPPEIAMT